MRTLIGAVAFTMMWATVALAAEAEKNCPVSKLLNCEITLEHNLQV